MNTKFATNWAVPPSTPAAAPANVSQKDPEMSSSGSNSLPPNGHRPDQEKPPIQILSIQEVEALVGLDKSTIYRLIAKGLFPDRVRLSPNRVGWIHSEVDAWLRARANERKEK